MTRTTRRIFLAGTALLLLANAPARAELLYAGNGGSLISFDSATPGTITTVNYSGLQKGETIVGFDLRPSNGLLYGISSASRLYTINPASGVVTQIGSSGAFTLNGNSFGMDFNPQVDLIRVVSDNEQNLRINPNGTLTGTDTALSPAGNIVSAAYDRNDTNPATLTTLYGIDSSSGMLVRIGGVDGSPSPNGGVVTNVGSTGLNIFSNAIGFDVSGATGVAYAIISGFQIPAKAALDGVAFMTSLYTINLSTGAATLVGTIGNGTIQYGSLTAATAIPEPSSVLLLGTAALFLGATYRARRQKR